MAGKTSARSSASHDQATSPPKRTIPESPVMPSTRSVRSASEDTSDGDRPSRRVLRPRGARQGSVESTGSIDSLRNTGKGKGKGKRNVTRGAAATVGELPIVTEDQEIDEEKREVAIEEEDQIRNPTGVMQSPGGLSNISGTTALTSLSQQELADLDLEIIVETLPELYNTAVQLLQLLAPSNISQRSIESAAKELQLPGSSLAKKLNMKEKAYESFKTAYGGDIFINVSHVLRKLFDDKPSPADAPDIDIILEEANLAMLVKTFLVAQRDSPDTTPLLQRLDDIFPLPFMTHYGDDAESGGSALLEETFNLALEIRTQTIISALKADNNRGYDPDTLLAQVFFEPPHHRNTSLSSYEDSFVNGECRTIAGATTDIFSEDDMASFSARIRRRAQEIREAFLLEQEGINDNEFVDLNRLNDDYPWIEFLFHLTKWIQERTVEIRGSIEKQGGIQNIANKLGGIVLEHPVSPSMQPPAVKRTLQPPAEIIPASTDMGFPISAQAANTILDGLSSSYLPPSNQQQRGAPSHLNRAAIASSSRGPITPRDKMSAPKEHATAPAKITDRMRKEQIQRDLDDDWRQYEDIDDQQQSTRERTTDEIVGEFFVSENDKNKENRPLIESGTVIVSKRRFVDPQKNAQRVTWTENEDTQLNIQSSANQKRSHQTYADEEEDEDEDAGAYQQDVRTVNSARRERTSIPVVPARRPVQPAHSPKRARLQAESEEPEEAAQRDETRMAAENLPDDQDEALQASARTATGEENEDQDEDFRPSSPLPTYREVNQQARELTRVAKAANTSSVRPRKLWNVQEETRLLRLIAKYGCQWSVIWSKGGFYHTRDQVSLKDKARNMKTDYLKAGSVLPLNFDGVTLGSKEIIKIKSYGMNPYRREGEEVGREGFDMDGNEVV